jgi:UDP-N-acetylmuramate dehydrogenase
MVADAADPESRSVGSFFKNPVVGPQSVPEGAPFWVQPDGTVKLAAAWLIESAGFSRGAALVGSARLSQKHPLALVNDGAAKASDIAASARLLQRGVFEKWGVTLHPEPLFVGPWEASELPEGASVFSPA